METNVGITLTGQNLTQLIVSKGSWNWGSQSSETQPACFFHILFYTLSSQTGPLYYRHEKIFNSKDDGPGWLVVLTRCTRSLASQHIRLIHRIGTTIKSFLNFVTRTGYIYINASLLQPLEELVITLGEDWKHFNRIFFEHRKCLFVFTWPRTIYIYCSPLLVNGRLNPLRKIIMTVLMNR